MKCHDLGVSVPGSGHAHLPYSVKTRIQAETDQKKVEQARELPSPKVKRDGAPRRLTAVPKAKARDVMMRIWNDHVGDPDSYLAYRTQPRPVS